MNNKPKQGQLCRHKRARDCYRQHNKDVDLTFWQPLTRSEILELAEIAPNDMAEQPEQISKNQIMIAFSKFIHGYRPGEDGWSKEDQEAFNLCNDSELKQAGLIKQQKETTVKGVQPVERSNKPEKVDPIIRECQRWECVKDFYLLEKGMIFQIASIDDSSVLIIVECKGGLRVTANMIMANARLIEDVKPPTVDPSCLPDIIWPEWAVCHAFDENGVGYHFSKRMRLGTNDFIELWVTEESPETYVYRSQDSGLRIDSTKYDWKKTLVMRPEKKQGTGVIGEFVFVSKKEESALFQRLKNTWFGQSLTTAEERVVSDERVFLNTTPSWKAEVYRKVKTTEHLLKDDEFDRVFDKREGVKE